VLAQGLFGDEMGDLAKMSAAVARRRGVREE